ncbi:MAG TPA: glycogen/starch/alpha-glucan phosphorylase [Bryobacteraceae bacterium]|nr:glycogen/starch/alpha-glucan phosphorylase [Bryobacteraceae bacterium]
MDATAVEAAITHEHTRTGISVEHLKRAFVDSLVYDQGRYPGRATTLDNYLAVASAIRDRVTQRWVNTIQTYVEKDVRVVCYFSAEFLLGPHLGNNLLNLGIEQQAKQAMEELGLDPQEILDQEQEPGLGNGGLGRLAACYMDSLATLEIPAVGFGIRYEYGIFDQLILDGWQVESTDKWLQWGNPWEIARPEGAVNVGFGGRTEAYRDDKGNYRVRWIPANIIKAVPYDTPILGYRTNTVNTLRLWKSEAIEDFNFSAFNIGDYIGSVRDKIQSENISKILYPNDEDIKGKELRLQQQYFFVSASIQNLIQLHLRHGRPIEKFHEKFAIQMNDTHPSIGVAELMRLLLDEHGMAWEPAWETTRNSLGYTNHTLLPEALEKWGLPLFQSLLPRHLEIIYEINRRFLEEVKAKFPGDGERVRRLSLVDESGQRYIRMAHLATVGSHAVNGVAKLHSELLKKDLLRDFYEMYPERFSNKTNGVTPRRWIALANPDMTRLISSRIGDGWIANLDRLRELEEYVDDSGFQEQWRETQHAVKRELVDYIEQKTGIIVDPASMFDAMVKRLHEYKRQHLNVLHIITLYHRIKKDPHTQVVPRTFLFGGKAAPGYFMAKLIIKLVNSVAEVVNSDADVAGRLRVVFLPNYDVTFGQHVYPAADLSEQISLAGKEASGTGNMKFGLNGALTVGTLDGANIEIREAVGAENFFLFGLTTDQVYAMKAAGYDPGYYYRANGELREALDAIAFGRFSRGDAGLFRPLVDSLRNSDPYMLLADYQSYIECQDRISRAYLDQDHWTRMSILNTARMGRFSSDRAVREYCDEIWSAKPVEVKLADLLPQRR